MARRRVFITGLGLVTPHGTDPREVFRRIFEAESAVVGVEVEDAHWVEEPIPEAPVDFDPGDVIPRGQRIFMARAGQMAVVAAHDALAGAGLLEGGEGPQDMGVYVGCGLGGSEALQDAYRVHYLKRRRVRPTTVPLTMANGPASHISMQFRLRGPTMTYSIACASSAVALGEAFRAIRDGYLEHAVAGGTEAMLNGGTVAAWQMLGVLAGPHASGYAAACRPFDRARSGLVLGEGAAMFVLECEDRVAARGAEPLGEVVGYGLGSDAHNLTEPHKDGQVQAMRAALADAGLEPDAIGYINAHATATPVGDVVEVEAVKEVFGDHAGRLAMSATKAVHGHLIGAAGALEGAVTVLALHEGRIPPTAHLTDPDEGCDLDLVPLEGRTAPDLEYALSNSFAFGGSDAALVFRKVG